MRKTLGILDSGIGGLSFVQPIMQKKLGLDLYYISDAKNVPYGNKPQVFMQTRIHKMIQVLADKQVDAVLMACNSATAQTIDHVRSHFEVPIVGIEPYMRHRQMVPSEQARSYALILTPATYMSKRFKELQQQNDPGGVIDVYPLEHLAMDIEYLQSSPFEQIKHRLKSELSPLQNKGYTHVILGCTHYTIIANWIAAFLQVEIVDPSTNIMAHLCEVMDLEDGYYVSSFQYSKNCGKSWSCKSIFEFPFLAGRGNRCS